VSSIISLDIEKILPPGDAVLRDQGMPEGRPATQRVHDALSDSIEIFASTAKPAAMLQELPAADFETIFKGEGKNAGETPLERVFPRAERLALFALTMGRDVCLRIEELFEKKNFAPGAFLDTVASLAAHNAVVFMEKHYHRGLLARGLTGSDSVVMGYSPGYCGWHISGQKKLFQYLCPGRIDISLNDSFLMNPLKSVTGLLVSGAVDIHLFDNTFPFCTQCRTKSCRQRIKALSQK